MASDSFSPRRSRIRSLGELAPAALGDALARQGFAGSEIVTRWPEIVGTELAPHCEPVRLAWPPRGPSSDPGRPREPAVLFVRVESAHALELQHMQAVVLERVNRYFGWACVGSLRFRQGPVTRRGQSARVRKVASDAARGRVADAVRGVEEPALAAALARLGEAVAAEEEGGT